MKISFRKLIPIAAAIGMTFATAAAHADVVTATGAPFTLKAGSDNAIIAKNANSLDWNQQGSGVAIGVGPFNDQAQLPVGAAFTFLYQANLASVGLVPGSKPTSLYKGLDNTSDGSADDGSSYEFTIVARLNEVVTGSSTVHNAKTGKDDPTALFGLGAGTSQVAIYYDTKMNANTVDGTGFDDGTLIALLTIVNDGTTSQFTAGNGTGTGGGFAKLHAVVDAGNGDFIDSNYIEGVTQMLFGINFESTLNYPANSADTTGFGIGGNNPFGIGDYKVGANDIVFKVDGSNSFTNVPEPGSMMLLGAGLLGLVGAARRRRASK